jgi:hypothetical protein
MISPYEKKPADCTLRLSARAGGKETMNKGLVGGIGGFGVIVGTASLFGLTRGVEEWLWLFIGIGSAFLIARHAPGHPFAHGFTGGALAALASSVLQMALFSTYAAHNPETATAVTQLPQGVSLRATFVLIAPLIAAASGVIVGLFAWIASKLVRRAVPAE